MVKISLNCFEAAYVTIGLTNDDVEDDFEIDLSEVANSNSTISLYHDVKNSRLQLRVDDEDFTTEFEDERLGSQKFKVCI